jgi:hypothetical protein
MPPSLSSPLSAADYTRQTSIVQWANPCPQPSWNNWLSTRFTFTAKGELAVDTGVCLRTAPLNGFQLWYKPTSATTIAIVVVNVRLVNQTLALPLGDVPGLSCSTCAVRDLWTGAGTSQPATQPLAIALRGHESAVFEIGPA